MLIEIISADGQPSRLKYTLTQKEMLALFHHISGQTRRREIPIIQEIYNQLFPYLYDAQGNDDDKESE